MKNITIEIHLSVYRIIAGSLMLAIAVFIPDRGLGYMLARTLVVVAGVILLTRSDAATSPLPAGRPQPDPVAAAVAELTLIGRAKFKHEATIHIPRDITWTADAIMRQASLVYDLLHVVTPPDRSRVEVETAYLDALCALYRAYYTRRQIHGAYADVERAVGDKRVPDDKAE